MSRPSPPAAPLLARTGLNACSRFSLLNVARSSIDPASSGTCRGQRASSLEVAAKTLTYGLPPRLRGHLTHCLSHRHAGSHSYSFGPSSDGSSLTGATTDHYDLC